MHDALSFLDAYFIICTKLRILQAKKSLWQEMTHNFVEALRYMKRSHNAVESLKMKGRVRLIPFYVFKNVLQTMRSMKLFAKK